jgi:hypothetical protein
MTDLSKQTKESNVAFAKRLANLAVERLQGLTDELEIKAAILPIWKSLINDIKEPNSRKTPAKNFRNIIRESFPDQDSSQSGYYATSAGKGKGDRHEHLSLWFVTENSNRWDIVGDAARQEYWGNLPKFDNAETTTEAAEIKPETTKEPVQETKPETPTEATQLTLETMNIKTLQLDTETEKKVQEALNYSGLSLADFIQKACTIYATTLTGKAKQFDSDLSAVDTETLLTSKEYSTHPARALELSKRAIRAIKIYNSEIATEKEERWHINQSAIQALTGSNATKIKKFLPQFQDDLDGHNQKHELTPYDNRKADKRKIEDIVNLAELVPDGMD